MKGNKKFIVMIAMVVLALLVAAGVLADEKLYTSDPYKIPRNRVEGADLIPEKPAEEQPSETGESGETGEQPEETPTGDQPGETGEVPTGEQPGETEGGEVTPEETPAEPETPKGPLPPEQRKVYVTTSRPEIVTEGDAIYLEAKLVGFDGLTVHYRWQVDKNDGQGWQDVGLDRNYHVFIATRETVQYSWRLIVDVEGE